MGFWRSFLPMTSRPDSKTSRQVSQLMCAATEALLWGPARAWVRERLPASELRCRTGSGQATYHQFDPATHQHVITYGQRMVAAKFESQSAHGWLSTREIRKYGYFDGQVSTANLLAHTCCHEFAHLLQSASGKRKRGSVHNAAFYRILEEMHDSGAAMAVRAFLLERAAHQDMMIPTASLDTFNAQARLEHFAIGDNVLFGTEGRQRQGEVIRINRRTCTVEGTGRWRGTRYRVPVSLMSHAENVY
tara:strand:- start:280 stop:1020 length:741 start_codon:yes stop_codon:yes gene_type:complete